MVYPIQHAPIRKDDEWELFDRLSPRRGPIRWGKNSHESDFLRNISRDNWIWLNNVRLVTKDPFFSKVRNGSSNIQYDSTRSSFVQGTGSSQLEGSSAQFRDHFDSISY